MLALYGKDPAACDEMTEAEFAGLAQNIDLFLRRQAKHTAREVAIVVSAMFQKP